MTVDEKLNQITDALTSLQEGQNQLKAQVEGLQRGQTDLQVDVNALKSRASNTWTALLGVKASNERLEARVKDLQEDSRKEHGELGENITHTGEEIQKLQHERDLHQDKRITRLEKHANLPSLE
ncbi:hypothetical protein ACFWZR_28435 [Streptomyces sp. NPDC059017]|uniref:hypothetical protein n=1 Tax=Streptomyces sp. NPDC059017 TaxID=3346700 RepID=UPI0036B1FF02